LRVRDDLRAALVLLLRPGPLGELALCVRTLERVVASDPARDPGVGGRAVGAADVAVDWRPALELRCDDAVGSSEDEMEDSVSSAVWSRFPPEGGARALLGARCSAGGSVTIALKLAARGFRPPTADIGDSGWAAFAPPAIDDLALLLLPDFLVFRPPFFPPPRFARSDS
jgi:hypothetical protein